MEERNELIKELFELHKLLADKGEISIGYGFSENYERLKAKVKKLTIPVVVRTLVCVDGSIPNLTEGKEYKILAETNRHYNLIDDNGNDVLIGKSYVRELKQAN